MTMKSVSLSVTTALMVLASCHGPDAVGTSSPYSPPTELTPDLIQGEVNRVAQSPVYFASTDLLLPIWEHAHTCPAEFDLGNGVRGTCSVDSVGPLVHAVSTGTEPLEVDWWIYMHPAVDGRSIVTDGGTARSLTTWDPREGANSFRVAGEVTVDGSGRAAGFRFQYGSGQNVWAMTPDGIQTAFSFVSRQSGRGTLSYGGRPLAEVEVDGGCTTIDFTDAAKDDFHSCQW